MSCTDPIADMLTRIRNAHMAGREMVESAHSKLKSDLLRVLKREGYILDFAVDGAAKKTLRIYLKYTDEREPVIRGARRESRPGLRRYASAGSIPRVLGGMGVVVLSTSRGVMTGREAKRQGIGGEVLCSVW